MHGVAIDKVQKRFIRMLPGMEGGNYKETWGRLRLLQSCMMNTEMMGRMASFCITCFFMILKAFNPLSGKWNR